MTGSTNYTPQPTLSQKLMGLIKQLSKRIVERFRWQNYGGIWSI